MRIMDNNIEEFVNYLYSPIRKPTIIKVHIAMALLGVIAILLSQTSITVTIVMVLLNVLIVIGEMYSARILGEQALTFYLQGVSCIYFSLLASVCGYYLVSMNRPLPISTLLYLVAFQAACISASIAIVYLLIKKNAYKSPKRSKYISIYSFGGTIIGFILARILLGFIKGNSTYIIFIVACCVLSIALSIPSAVILKYYYLVKQMSAKE